MKLTIIADDKLVSKDGVGYSNLDLSFLDSDVWAVQWDTDKGHIEKRDLSIVEITDITPFNTALTKWDEANTLANTPDAPVVSTEASVRNVRNGLLAESDWTVLADSPLSDTKIAEWKTYRQALRDLPANTSDFANPIYPTEPT
tara:strand:- start:1609 stop:2040 length:432 start_codon:yes stop_codon:yes gene_type:complete